MKSITPLRALSSLLLIVFGSFAFSGCNEIEDTVAVVYVDQTFIGELRFDTTQVTNAAGSVSFNFSEYYKQGQAGFAVLDIEATKGSLTGIGIIKIEEELTNEQTVIME